MCMIDWGKAPEGATHCFPGTGDWYIATGRPEYSWSRAENKWMPAYFWNERKDSCVARPSSPAWSGEGLPPVGVQCEIKHRALGWVACEIIAHKTFCDDSHTLAIAWINSDTLDQSSGIRFRPIRTPEQKAAAEREAVINDLAAELGGHWSEEAVEPQRKLAAYLHDIGYRKVEQPK